MAFGASSNDVEIIVRVDAQGAISVLDQFGNKVKEVDSATAQAASSGFSTLQAGILTLESSLNLASRAFGALQTGLSSVFTAVSGGSAIDDVTTAFQELTTEAGTTADALLNKLNAATAETIPNLQLMQQANELLIGGLRPDQIELVASAARTLGERTGKDAAEGMNQLADSLLRGNDRALKTLGIVVDNSKAMLDFAKANGIAVENLSEVAKVEAIRQASLKALAEQQERFTQATLDGGDRINQINKALTEGFNAVIQKIAGDEGLNKKISELVVTLKSIDYASIANGFITIANAVISVTNAVAKAGSALAAFANKNSAVDKSIAKSLPGYQQFDDKLTDIIDLLSKGTKESTSIAINEFNKLGRTFQEMNKNGDLTKTVVNALNGEFAKVDQQVRDAGKYFGILKEEVAATVPPLARAKEGLVDVIKAASDAEEAAKKLAKLSEAADDAAASGLDLGEFGDRFAKEAIDEMDRAFKRQQELLGSVFGDVIGQALTGGDVRGAIQSAGGVLGAELGTTLGASVGGPFGAAFGNAIGSAIGQKIFKDISGIVDGGDASRKGARTLIDTFFPGIGTGLDSLIGDKLFGSSQGTQTRKAIDRFFADAFDAERLLLVINGELEQITDLALGGGSFGSNSQFFDGLSQSAINAFTGVATGFTSLLGVGNDAALGLAQAFSSNVGGSLNNLQLLVEATGKSFEDLKSAVIEAFLDGQLSISEAQNALVGIAQIAEDGIPGALGATVQALDNVFAAGTRGGRYLIDAFTDVAFEAKELGIKDFGALAQNIAASGKYSYEQLTAYFDAFRQAGITNVEQLARATEEQLISVGANLQNQGLLQEAVDQAQSFVDQVNNMPTEKTLTFNIKTNFDSNTIEAQKQGYIPALSTNRGPGVVVQ